MRYRLRTLLILLAACGAYFASYRALLRPVVIVDEGHLGRVVSGYRRPAYLAGEPLTSFLFWPAAWMDRQTRPGYWGTFSEIDSPSQ
jgi:hypothetical protein